MLVPLTFFKLSGAGNDFVLLDNMDGQIILSQAELARALCSRPFGVGADGLLVIEPSERADFMMRYYNADGSYGGMCGNGGRCIARYAARAGHTRDSMRFEALDHVYSAHVLADGTVRLRMKDATGFRSVGDNPGFPGRSAFINTGSPHLIVLVPDVEDVDVAREGRKLRFDGRFAPEGTNVNFVQVLSPTAIRVRTYERGVEAETLACGTGSVASAIVAAIVEGASSPVRVHVRSGESLRVSFSPKKSFVTDVILEGSAHILFQGKTFYDTVSGSLSHPISAK